MVGAACFRESALGVSSTDIRLLEHQVTLVPQTHADRFAGELRVYNGSSRPVGVDNVRTDCGCVVSEWPDGTIASGDTLSLPVVLRCRGRGEQVQAIEIWLTGVRAPLRATVVGACEAADGAK